MTLQIITDKSGRHITLRRVGVLETLRLYKALGSELSINAAYVAAASIAASAAMIDDVPLPFPVNEAGVEAVLERLGEDGVAAIVSATNVVPVDTVVAEAGN